MNRRKFLLGTSGLVAGSSAILGSGAFGSVEANRNVAVTVANDQNAYLVLDAISENFAEDGQLLSFQFDNEVAPEDGGTFDETGDGVSPNSVYEFTNLFQAQNQGTKPMVLFGQYDDTELESVQLIEEGRQTPVTRQNPSSVVESPGDFIRVGLRLEIGDIPPQGINTEVSIVAATEDSERFPEVFPNGS